MSDQQNQEEPSMEEILASIRRIISEDDPEEGQGEKEAAEPEAAESEAPEAEAEVEPEPEAEAPVEEPAAEDEEEELELTEKVNADGSPLEETAESEAAEEAPEPKPIFDDEEAPEPEPEPEPELEAVEEEPAEETPLEEPPVDEAPVEESPVEESGEDLEVALELDDDLPTEAGDDTEESLISEPTQVAASSALSEIARAAITQRALAIGEGRTLEDLVREALRPELKHWLDAHLASMVERIVREEIKKMVRRVENQ